MTPIVVIVIVRQLINCASNGNDTPCWQRRNWNCSISVIMPPFHWMLAHNCTNQKNGIQLLGAKSCIKRFHDRSKIHPNLTGKNSGSPNSQKDRTQLFKVWPKSVGFWCLDYFLRIVNELFVIAPSSSALIFGVTSHRFFLSLSYQKVPQATW